MKQYHNVKMRNKENLTKSKDSRLKMLQGKEKRITQENDRLHNVIASKEAEELSMMDVLEESERVNQENNKLQQKVLELERKSQIIQQCRGMKLKDCNKQ